LAITFDRKIIFKFRFDRKLAYEILNILPFGLKTRFGIENRFPGGFWRGGLLGRIFRAENKWREKSFADVAQSLNLPCGSSLSYTHVVYWFE
jgi:hypothetical protein